MTDAINPTHYTRGAVECIDVTESLNFCLGNAFKYVFRFRDKGRPLEDLRKACWYLDREMSARASSEEWREFPSDCRYEISSQGRVRMKGKNPRKLVPLKNGYLTFVVSSPEGNKCYYAHRAVAEAFLDFDPSLEVCHLDGTRTNNSVWNLRQGTTKANHSHKHIHGTDYKGGDNPSAKLSANQVLTIRALEGCGTCAEVGSRFGVSAMTIQRIWSGVAWSEIPSGPIGSLAAIVEGEADPDVAAALELIAIAQWSSDGIEDVKKARWYLERLIAHLDKAEFGQQNTIDCRTKEERAADIGRQLADGVRRAASGAVCNDPRTVVGLDVSFPTERHMNFAPEKRSVQCGDCGYPYQGLPRQHCKHHYAEASHA